jgi:hypothetical protein
MTMLVQTAPIAMFWSRDAGYLALLLLTQAEAGDADSAPTFSAMANKLAVSRTHIRTLCMDAAEAGYVRLHGAGGSEVRTTPLLRRAFDEFIADMGARYDALTLTALRELAQDPEVG